MLKILTLLGLLGLASSFPALGKTDAKAATKKTETKPAMPVIQYQKERPMMWSIFLDGKALSILPVEQNGKLYLPLQDISQFLNMDVRIDSKMRLVDLKTRGNMGTTIVPYQIKEIKKVAILPFLENSVEKAKEDSTLYPGTGEAFTTDFAKILFEKALFAIVPHNINGYNWDLNEVKEIGKRLGVEGVLIGRIKRSEFRTEPGFFNDYMVEVIAETVLIETNTGAVVWRQEEGGRNAAFNPFTAGAEGRRKRFITDIVYKASQKMVEELTNFKKLNG